MPRNPKTYSFDYGFPLFVPDTPRSYLIKHEKIRVSDIWGFWDYLVKTHTQKRSHQQGQFLQTMLEQARYFFAAAETAPLHSQPLLYYYSFLNIAKIVINIYYNKGNAIEYYHGIETKVSHATSFANAEVSFKQYGGINSAKISVAKEFLTILGDNINVPNVVSIKKLLQSCIGINRTYCEIFNEKETFYRLVSPKEVLKYGRLISFDSDVKNMNLTIANMPSLRRYNLQRNAEGRYIFHAEYTMPNYNFVFNSWQELARETIRNGIWSYTDGNEYRMYISSQAQMLSSASIIYCIMFFLGSITRYHPYFFDSLLSTKEQWLIDEFLHTQPLQFMYMVTSKVVGNYVYHTRQMTD